MDGVAQLARRASLDVALTTPAAAPSPGGERASGVVELLALAAAAEAPMTLVQQATAQAGRGLRGDRYFDARGTFSDPHATGNDLTLIEAEVLEQLAATSASRRRRTRCAWAAGRRRLRPAAPHRLGERTQELSNLAVRYELCL